MKIKLSDSNDTTIEVSQVMKAYFSTEESEKVSILIQPIKNYDVDYYKQIFEAENALNKITVLNNFDTEITSFSAKGVDQISISLQDNYSGATIQLF